MAVTCANGHENLDGMAFCEECGVELTAVTDRPQPDAPDVQVQSVVDDSPPPSESDPSSFIVDEPAAAETSPPAVGEPELVVQDAPDQQLVAEDLPTPMASPIPPPVPGATSGAHLEISQGPHAGRRFDVTEPSCTIGRWDMDAGSFPEIDLTDVDVDAKISRKHARITVKDASYFIEDLGSLNGTSRNRGPRLLPGDVQPLMPGDELIVGKLFLRFVSN